MDNMPIQLSEDAIRVLRQIHQRGLKVHWYHLTPQGYYEDGEPMSEADLGIVVGELTLHWERIRSVRHSNPGYLDETDIHENDDWYDSYESGIWYRYTLTDKALSAIDTAFSGVVVKSVSPEENERMNAELLSHIRPPTLDRVE